MLTEHDLIIRRAVVAARGREVKHTGNGIMASFDDVAGALSCANAIQGDFGAWTTTTDRPPLRVRIGMAAGEPVDRGNDPFGSTVTLASRIRDAADGGHTLVSDVVRDLGANLGYAFVDAGPRILQWIEAPSQLLALQRAPAG